MVGIRWNDWNRMPTRSRRNRASPSSSSVPRSTPSTSTRPPVGRSIPPMIDIRLDLPEPEGPTTLTLVPASTVRSMPRRIATGPAVLGRVRCTHRKARSSPSGIRSPGDSARVRRWRWIRALLAQQGLGGAGAACLRWLRRRRPGPAAWRARRSLAAGYGVPEADAFPARLERALRSGAWPARCSTPASRATPRPGGPPAGLGAGRPADPPPGRAWAATMRCADCRWISSATISTKSSATAKGAACRSCWPGCWHRPISRRLRRCLRQVYQDLAEAHDRALPVLPGWVVLQDGLMQPDGIHPNARGVRVIVERIAPLVAEIVKATEVC